MVVYVGIKNNLFSYATKVYYSQNYARIIWQGLRFLSHKIHCESVFQALLIIYNHISLGIGTEVHWNSLVSFLSLPARC